MAEKEDEERMGSISYFCASDKSLDPE